MAESESIKEIINGATIQVAMMVLMALRNTETGPQLTSSISQKEPLRLRQSGPVLVKLTFN